MLCKNILKFLAYFKKWSLTAVVVLTSVGFVISGHMTGEQFKDLHAVVIPAFVGANLIDVGKEVLRHWMDMKFVKEEKGNQS